MGHQLFRTMPGGSGGYSVSVKAIGAGGGGVLADGYDYGVTFNFRASNDAEAVALVLEALKVLGGTYDLVGEYVTPERHSDRKKQRVIQAGGGPRG